MADFQEQGRCLSCKHLQYKPTPQPHPFAVNLGRLVCECPGACTYEREPGIDDWIGADNE